MPFASKEKVKRFTYLAFYDELTEVDYNLSVSNCLETIGDIIVRDQGLRNEINKIIQEIEVDA